MNNQTNLSIGEAGSILMGFGLGTVATSINIGLILVGVGAGLKVIVAVLNRYDIPVNAAPLG